METPPLPPACTKQGHQKPLDSKDDNTEKHCPVTVNPWHMKKAFKVMNELRSQNLLCDVTIVAEDMEISAHRVVLAACSPYFHAMFTGMKSFSYGCVLNVYISGLFFPLLTFFMKLSIFLHYNA